MVITMKGFNITLPLKFIGESLTNPRPRIGSPNYSWYINLYNESLIEFSIPNVAVVTFSEWYIERR